jgi:DNA-binding response OmpR family regulator
VMLPAQVEPITPRGGPESAATPVPSPASGPLGTVLVIEDDPDAQNLIERHLTREGFAVQKACEGKRGLELARQLKPDVITLDVMMPGTDGWTVLSALKADAATASIPVLMLTIVDDKQMGFALGAVDYFVKPIDWERLSTALKRYAGRAQPGQALVVEDDAQTRELLVRMLHKEGWQTVEAENGRIALERLAGTKPAVILLDLMMPEMDGFEFMDELRKRADCKGIPVLVVTARDMTEEDRRRLNGQVARIIQKSRLNLDELAAELRALVGRGRSLASADGVTVHGK